MNDNISIKEIGDAYLRIRNGDIVERMMWVETLLKSNGLEKESQQVRDWPISRFGININDLNYGDWRSKVADFFSKEKNSIAACVVLTDPVKEFEYVVEVVLSEFE